MENRIYKAPTPSLARSHSAQRLKFKEIPFNQPGFNELNSKYELYKRGTPNQYSSDLQVLRAKNIKNEVAMMDLPAIESIISQLALNEGEKHVNQRNYDLYPNLLKQPKGRYKEMLSEKQQIKDFIIWFENQFQNIERSHDAYPRKFENKQTLIAAGFNEMIGQVGKSSKNRAEILKMLWNRQNQEVGQIIQVINGQNIKKQFALLEQINKVHGQYQREIENCQRSNKELQENFRKQSMFNKSLVQNLRSMRKRIKKLQYLVKKLSESNQSTKRENLNLIQQNVKLLMNIKDISEEEALILNYRRLQVYQQRQKLKCQKTKALIELSEIKKQEDKGTSLQELEEKKKALFDYFLERLKENPDQKVFIKEQYFTDDEENIASIEDYFKTIVNKSNIKMELLNEDVAHICFKEKGMNTEKVEDPVLPKLSLLLEKGIQVQMSNDGLSSLRDGGDLRDLERRVYQIINPKEEEHIEKQSKKRIIQHRLSRKNSLTLLQVQSLGEMGSKLFDRKGNVLSKFGRRGKHEQQNLDSRNYIQGNDSQIHSIEHSQGESEADIMVMSSLNKDSELVALNLNTKMTTQRKSINFSHLLEQIKENIEKQESICEKDSDKMIKLDEEVESEIRLSQLQDLIRKHLLKNEETKVIQNPQKYLNRFLQSLFKNIFIKKQFNFTLQLLEVIKNSYGNTKSVIWKFLSIVSIIKSNSQSSSVLKIISVFLKANEKFKSYDEVNKQEIAELYFRLFFLLSIKGVNDNAFNLWKACTSLEKIKGLQFMALLEEFLSPKKRSYVENKIQELIYASHMESSKKNHSSELKKQAKSEQIQIVKLNPILLYVIQVYLIEKQLYYSSYSEMVDFISSEGQIPTDYLIWMIQFLGFDQARQTDFLSYFLTKKQFCRDSAHSSQYLIVPSESNCKNLEKYVKNDHFYRLCVRFDMPLFEELQVVTCARFKLLPSAVQQEYFRMIGVQQWKQIKASLREKYQKIANSQLYLKAFTTIIEKLEQQISRGCSIYRQEFQKEKKKRKEEIFSLFYKIIIIEAHRNLLEPEEEVKGVPFASY